MRTIHRCIYVIIDPSPWIYILGPLVGLIVSTNPGAPGAVSGTSRLAEGQVLNIDPDTIITSDSRNEAKQLTLFVPHKRRAQICQGT